MHEYKHIFFDLDQTLWDFERCSAETISELFEKYNLSSFISEDCNYIIKRFSDINNALWHRFSAGEIDKDYLRHRRFRLVFDNFPKIKEDLIERITEDYLLLCPKKGHLIPHAIDVLNYLVNKYELHILTNGFDNIQHQKLESSGLMKYFKEIITSETIGYKKPEKEIFTYALNKVNCISSNCLMIGDSLDADILGASNSNIDHVFYNPGRLKNPVKVTYEINCLSELKRIL